MSWHERVRAILESETGDLKALARVAGVNPRHFYRGVSLAGTDLRGQDLTDLDLTGCDLTAVITNKSTKFSAVFDPNIEGESTRRTIRLSRNLYLIVRVFEAELSYIYTGWAIKKAIERNYIASCRSNLGGVWLEWLARSDSGKRTVELSALGGAYSYSLKIKTDHYHELLKTYKSLGSANRAMRMAVLVGIFDYWNASPETVGEGSILDFLLDVQKRPAAKATLLSLAKTWS